MHHYNYHAIKRVKELTEKPISSKKVLDSELDLKKHFTTEHEVSKQAKYTASTHKVSIVKYDPLNRDDHTILEGDAQNL